MSSSSGLCFVAAWLSLVAGPGTAVASPPTSIVVEPVAPGAPLDDVYLPSERAGVQPGLAPIAVDAIVAADGCGAMAWSHSPLAGEPGPWCVAVARGAGVDGALLVIGRPGARAILLAPMRVALSAGGGEVVIEHAVAVSPSPPLVAAVAVWAAAPGGAR